VRRATGGGARSLREPPRRSQLWHGGAPGRTRCARWVLVGGAWHHILVRVRCLRSRWSRSRDNRVHGQTGSGAASAIGHAIRRGACGGPCWALRVRVGCPRAVLLACAGGGAPPFEWVRRLPRCRKTPARCAAPCSFCVVQPPCAFRCLWPLWGAHLRSARLPHRLARLLPRPVDGSDGAWLMWWAPERLWAFWLAVSLVHWFMDFFGTGSPAFRGLMGPCLICAVVPCMRAFEWGGVHLPGLSNHAVSQAGHAALGWGRRVVLASCGGHQNPKTPKPQNPVCIYF